MSFTSSNHFDVHVVPFHRHHQNHQRQYSNLSYTNTNTNTNTNSNGTRQSSILSLLLDHDHLDHDHAPLSRISECHIRDTDDDDDDDSFHDCIHDSDQSDHPSQNNINQSNCLNHQLSLPAILVPSTPIPTRQMLMICLVTFVEPVQFGMLFPFIYFLVRLSQLTT